MTLFVIIILPGSWRNSVGSKSIEIATKKFAQNAVRTKPCYIYALTDCLTKVTTDQASLISGDSPKFQAPSRIKSSLSLKMSHDMCTWEHP